MSVLVLVPILALSFLQARGLSLGSVLGQSYVRRVFNFGKDPEYYGYRTGGTDGREDSWMDWINIPAVIDSAYIMYGGGEEEDS